MNHPQFRQASPLPTYLHRTTSRVISSAEILQPKKIYDDHWSVILLTFSQAIQRFGVEAFGYGRIWQPLLRRVANPAHQPVRRSVSRSVPYINDASVTFSLRHNLVRY
jgi:hypothetical protein